MLHINALFVVFVVKEIFVYIICVDIYLMFIFTLMLGVSLDLFFGFSAKDQTFFIIRFSHFMQPKIVIFFIHGAPFSIR